MKAVLEFDLIEEREALEMAICAHDAHLFIYNFRNKLRKSVENCFWDNHELNESECLLLTKVFDEFISDLNQSKIKI
jgi:hypothetical protein